MEIYSKPQKSVELVDVTEQWHSGDGHSKTHSEKKMNIYFSLSTFKKHRSDM